MKETCIRHSHDILFNQKNRHELYAVGNTALGPKNLRPFQPIHNKGLARSEITIAEGSSEQGFVVVCATSQGSTGPSDPLLGSDLTGMFFHTSIAESTPLS